MSDSDIGEPARAVEGDTDPKVGGLVYLAGDRGEVVRPDGTTVTVSGGCYVLQQTGLYVVDGVELQVQP